MSVYAISDLHLPGHNQKPMEVFGDHWLHHFEKISDCWQQMITENDIVLLAGDISWAMRLSDALDDLYSIGRLNGQKILIRGNHEYWWNSLQKIRDHLPNGMFVLQNDALQLDRYAFCGTRGWCFPTAVQSLSESDMKIYQRELLRLKMSLDAAKKLNLEMIAMMHFPPLLADGHETGFVTLLEQYPVSHVVYGHLHGGSISSGFRKERNGIQYHLTSCDALNFCPIKICD